MIRLHASYIAGMILFIGVVLYPIYPWHQIATHLHGGDALHNIWLVNWGQEMLWSAPWNYTHIPLFDLGPGLRAFTSGNLVQEFLTGPLRLFGNPVLSYNLAMLLNALLCGVAMYAFAYWLTGKCEAAALAGVVYAANPWMQWHLWGHPNISAPFGFPLAFLFLALFRQDQSPRWAWLTGLAVFLQFLASIYLGVILMMTLGLAWLIDQARQGRSLWPKETHLIGAGTVALTGAYLLTLPYQRMAELAGNTRGIDQAILFSASPWGYLFPPRWAGGPQTLLALALGDFPVSQRIEDVGFAGYTALSLAIAGLTAASRHGGVRNRWLWKITACAAAAVLLSFGPLLWLGEKPSSMKLPGWWIYEYLEPLRFMRASARFSIVLLFAVSAASAVGFALLLERTPVVRRPLLLIGGGALLFLEFFPVSAPPRMSYPAAAFNAIRSLPEGASIAPYPFGNERFLPAISTTFPTTPSGSDGGVYLHPYQERKEALASSPDELLLPRYRALGVDYLYILEKHPTPRPILSLRPVAAWEGGFLVPITGVNPDKEFAKRWQPLRWRPPLAGESAFNSTVSWSPPRVITRDSHGEWQEHTADLEQEGVRFGDLEESFGLVSRGRPLGKFRRVVIEFRHNKKGVDYERARLRWITTERPELDTAPVVRSWVSGTNDWQVVEFKLAGHARFQAQENLSALFLALPEGTYPGLQIYVRRIAIAGD